MKQYRYLALTEGKNPQEPTGLLRELETDSEYFLEYLDENGEWILDYELATYTFGESPNAVQVNDASARQIASKIAPAKKFHLAGTDQDHDQSDHAPNQGGQAKGKRFKDSDSLAEFKGALKAELGGADLDKYLLHGTTATAAGWIEKLGIEPDVGDFIRDAYEGEYIGAGIDFDSLATPLSYFAPASNGNGAMTAMQHHVARSLEKGFHDVTEDDIREHGAVIVVDRESGDFTEISSEGRDSGTYPEGWVAVEPGDIVSEASVSAERVLKGEALLKLWRPWRGTFAFALGGRNLKRYAKLFHGDHDQDDHGNWADGKGGQDAKDGMKSWLDRLKAEDKLREAQAEGLVEDSPEFKRWREENPEITDNNFFADSPGWQQLMTRLEGERKARRTEERLAIMKDAAEQVGGLPEGLKLEYVDEPGAEFTVGEEKWTTGAHFDPQADTIRFFSGTFSDADFIPGAMSHEISHARFQRMKDAIGEETRHMHGVLTLEERQKLRDPDTFKLTAEGRFRYPATAVFEMLYNEQHKDFREQLIREDGVSPYSISYWKHYDAVRDKGMPDARNTAQYGAFDRAVDETLAEVNKAKAFGTWTYANKSWDQLDGLLKLVGKNTRTSPYNPA